MLYKLYDFYLRASFELEPNKMAERECGWGGKTVLVVGRWKKEGGGGGGSTRRSSAEFLNMPHGQMHKYFHCQRRVKSVKKSKRET